MFDTHFTKIIRRFYQLLLSNKKFSGNLTGYKYSDKIINTLILFQITDPQTEEETPESVDISKFG
jgi:hypothetical protein